MKKIFFILTFFLIRSVYSNEVNVTHPDLLAFKSIYITKNSNRNYFSFSAKYPMITNPFGNEELNYNMYFAYSQKSIWRPSDTSGNDENYLYTNFNPELIYTYDFRNNFKLPLLLNFGFEHESDGLGKIFDGIHREWDRFYINPQYSYKEDLFKIGVKVWYASLDLKYNNDIVKYMGFTELKLSTTYLKNYYNPLIELTIRKGSTTRLDDFTIIFEERFSIFNFISEKYKSPIDLYAQYFNGYGEYLRSYNRKTTNLRFGLSFQI